MHKSHPDGVVQVCTRERERKREREIKKERERDGDVYLFNFLQPREVPFGIQRDRKLAY
jgi:hypothetical protein